MNSDTTPDFPKYPEGNVLGSLDPAHIDGTLSALAEMGIAGDTIGLLTATDVEGVETPLDRTGLRGFVERLLLSMGEDLERLDQLRQELANGRTVVAVPVSEKEERARHRVAEILRDHGGRGIHYAGRWTIDPLR